MIETSREPFVIDPPVEGDDLGEIKWEDRTENFLITIHALDKKGRRINNKQLFIKYNIQEGKTEADINSPDTKTLYSDRDGVIELEINKRCTVTIEAYAVDLYNDELGYDEMPDIDLYIKRTVVYNLYIPFAPRIIGFSAKYISEEILPVREPIPHKYIELTFKWWNGQSSYSTKTRLNKIDENLYNLTPDYVAKPETNECNLKYYDVLLENTWEDDIIVIGAAKRIKITAKYIGDENHLLLRDYIKKEDVIVKLWFTDGEKEYSEDLSIDQWQFTSTPQITRENDGKFGIEFDELRTSIKVKFGYVTIDSDGYLDAWYEGLPVKVGKDYDPDKFRIYVVNPKLKRQVITPVTSKYYLDYNDCIVEPPIRTLNEPGLHWFTVKHRTSNGTILEDKVGIYCIAEDEFPKDEFEIFRLDPKIKSYIDVTISYDDCTKIENIRYINWENILDRIKFLNHYGTLLMHAPPFTGLSTRYTTEWKIYCDDENGLRAEFIKNIFKNKEDNNGNEN